MPGWGPERPYSSGLPLTRIGTPLAWAFFSMSPKPLGAMARTHAAPTRPESMTALRSCVCLLGLKLGSWTTTCQPLEPAYPWTPLDSPCRAGGASDRGENTRLLGSVEAAPLLELEELEDDEDEVSDDDPVPEAQADRAVTVRPTVTTDRVRA